MAANKVDYLIAQSNNDYLAGYVKWFTDEPVLHDYPATVIFPRADPMITIWHGSTDPAQASPPAWAMRGVAKRLSAPVMLSVNFAAALDAEKVVETMKGFIPGRISLLNEDAMSSGFVKRIREHLRGAEFVDLTEEIDQIKAVKSAEEIERIRANALLHDEAMKACFEAIRPGVREYEVAAAGRYRCMMLGSEQQIIFIGSSPAGQPVPFNMCHAMNRRIEAGDQVGILIEANDASGYYTHLYRMACLGRIPDELAAHFELSREAQQVTLRMLKPGADPIEMLKATNDFLRNHGLPIETRLYAHGQGYDMVERPSFQPGETMKIQANMNISVHPAAAGNKAFAMITDNYLVTQTGISECIHRFPKEITLLG